MSVKLDTLNTKENKISKKQYKFEPIEEINVGLLHQVVKGSRTNFRNNTASVKTRAQVSGTGAKPWAQKGTGRARQGSLRSPPVSYTHLRAHETRGNLVCRLLLEKKK